MKYSHDLVWLTFVMMHLGIFIIFQNMLKINVHYHQWELFFGGGLKEMNALILQRCIKLVKPYSSYFPIKVLALDAKMQKIEPYLIQILDDGWKFWR